MSNQKQLVLDIGGVLATNLSPFFWEELSTTSKIHYDKLIEYKNSVRTGLWTGKITEDQFWSGLSMKHPSIEKGVAKPMLLSHLKLLPAVHHVAKWSQFADIHILSNHRMEWIEPILKEIQNDVKSITVSSEVGYCKPHKAIYTTIQTKLDSEKETLFVDDQEQNFVEARTLGWRTLLADEQGSWINQIMPLLLSAKFSLGT
ncbi:HAD family hydrolase [Cytobacillus sp. Hm23]